MAVGLQRRGNKQRVKNTCLAHWMNRIPTTKRKVAQATSNLRHDFAVASKGMITLFSVQITL